MSKSLPAHDLLFGLIALQTGLVHQVQLVEAVQAWALDKSRSLAEHLVGRGDLDADDRMAVEGLVDRHLSRNGDSAERSLTAITVDRPMRESLARLGGPEIDTTLGPTTPGRCRPRATASRP